MVPHLNTSDYVTGSSTRFDFNADGSTNLTDMYLLVPFLNLSCTP